MPEPDDLVADVAAFIPGVLEVTGALALKHFRAELFAEDKGSIHGYDPVTEADRGIEDILRAAVAERYPDHQFKGEERGTSGPDGRYRWVVDPIDGTKAFVSGVPMWGTLDRPARRRGPRRGLAAPAVPPGDLRRRRRRGHAARAPATTGRCRSGPAVDHPARRGHPLHHPRHDVPGGRGRRPPTGGCARRSGSSAGAATATPTPCSHWATSTSSSRTASTTTTSSPSCPSSRPPAASSPRWTATRRLPAASSSPSATPELHAAAHRRPSRLIPVPSPHPLATLASRPSGTLERLAFLGAAQNRRTTMAVSEKQRHELMKAMEGALGPEPAETLMNLLPPVGWADVATKYRPRPALLRRPRPTSTTLPDGDSRATLDQLPDGAQGPTSRTAAGSRRDISSCDRRRRGRSRGGAAAAAGRLPVGQRRDARASPSPWPTSSPERRRVRR